MNACLAGWKYIAVPGPRPEGRAAVAAPPGRLAAAFLLTLLALDQLTAVGGASGVPFRVPVRWSGS